MTDAQRLEAAHNEYQTFVANPNHRGYPPEGYWMASRALLTQWLNQLAATPASLSTSGVTTQQVPPGD